MRSRAACLGIALGALWIAHESLADDPDSSQDSLARMPANPVTSPAPADNAGAAPTDSRRHGRDKHEQHADAASAPAAPASTPGASSAAAAQLPAPPATPKKICRNMDTLGSKIPKRVCATPDEWASFEGRAHDDTMEGLRHLRDQGAIAPPSPGVSPSQLPPTR